VVSVDSRDETVGIWAVARKASDSDPTRQKVAIRSIVEQKFSSSARTMLHSVNKVEASFLRRRIDSKFKQQELQDSGKAKREGGREAVARAPSVFPQVFPRLPGSHLRKLFNKKCRTFFLIAAD
jgi:hypothetical protein